MKLKNPEALLEDRANIVRLRAENSRTNASERSSIEKYFEQKSGTLSILANDYAAIAANDYIEFVAAELFPADGSWITFDSVEQDTEKTKKIKSELLEIVSEELDRSNFYSETSKLIKEGVLYNAGLIQTSYNNGLHFQTSGYDTMEISEDADLTKNRAYVSDWVTVYDLIDRYEGKIINRLKDQYKNDLSMTVELITAIIPCDDVWFTKKSKSYNWKKVFIVCSDGEKEEVRKKGEDKNIYFNTFPIMLYLPHLCESLASKALVNAVRLDSYEQLLEDKSRKSLNPPMSLGKDLFINGDYNFSEGGLNPLELNEREPSPVETKTGLSFTENDIQRIMNSIDRVFKTRLIERIQTTTASQYELATNYLNALKSIQPSASSLMTSLPKSVLTRVDRLLKKHNKKYKELRASLEGTLEAGGYSKKMRKLEKLAGIGKAMQGLAPYLQANPASVQKVNTDKIVETLLSGYGNADAIVSDEEVAEERQAMAQQQQQAQQQEQEVAQADVAQKLGGL